MKLHLGCNTNRKDGWTNLDVMPGPGVDIVDSAHELKDIKDESVDEILAEHLLEHLTFYEAQRALAEWYRVLIRGGVLTIEVPDLLGLCRAFVGASEYQRFQSNKGHWGLIHHIYGNQRGRNQEEILSQVHKSGYTSERLDEMLWGVGFHSLESQVPVKNTPGSCVIRVRAIK
jgi:predicted SAM-dependent methyltransferase